MTKTLEVPTACGPIAPRLHHSREVSATLSSLLEARQEGLDALESLALAVGTCTESMPRARGEMIEAWHLDVLLTQAIQAFRLRQVETRELLYGDSLKAMA